MKMFGRSLFPLVLLSLALPALAQDMSADEVIEKLKENPIPSSYTADMSVDMTSGGMPITMDGAIAFDEGAMRMESEMTTAGQRAETTVVIDREGMQWIETKMPAANMTQVMKMDTAVLKDSMGDLPGMDMTGQGGMNFQFTPDMYDSWQETMDLSYEGTETVDGTETYVLSGTYREEFVEQLDPNGNMRRMNALPDRTIFYVAKDNSFPVRVEMESAQGVNGTVSLSNVNLNPEFEEGTFTYTPPPGVEPMDVTGMMRQQMNTMRGESGADN